MRDGGSFGGPWKPYMALNAPDALKLKTIPHPNGVPLEVVSKRLGHSNIGVTAERYLHVHSDRDAAAASVFETLCG